MKKALIILWLCLKYTVLFASAASDHEKEAAYYVNPFIGASTNIRDAGASHGLGKTIPGATYPFGLVQLSPNTITGGDNGPGYSYEHESIEGFAFTQMSGIGWYGDLGNFLVMPTTGPMHTNSGKLSNPDAGYRSRYDKKSEQAKAGYYSVKLSDYQIQAEATVTQHAGILRFTYPKCKNARIQIDLARRVGGTSTWQEVKVVDDHTISGKMICPPEGGGWGNGDGKADYTVYFYAQFSKPLQNYGVWSAAIPEGQSRKREFIESDAFQQIVSQAEIHKQVSSFQGKHIGFFSEFETQEGEEVLMKAGISFVSEANARLNLETDIADWNFERIRHANYQAWNEALSRIEIDTQDENLKHIFYTALYRTMLDPRLFADVNGEYPGGDKQIHRSHSFHKRTIFSGWDVFRSEMPLLTLIRPDVVNDLLNSLITLAEESGKDYLERWEFLNAYTGCMVGNPAISVLVDAYRKGIRDYDVEKAWQYADRTSRMNGNAPHGYVPHSISKTLEYAYTEWCMAEWSKDLGKTQEEQHYRELAQSYRNIYDNEHQSFRPKDEQGQFLPWPAKGRLTEGYGCTESNPFQQGWFVPHDIDGLAELMGGREKALEELDYMFAHTPSHFLWNQYYNHANEPVHHVPFLYNRLGQPWKTQYWTHFICLNAYKNEVKGLVGNEDVGQMSAWYVLASIGLHPICPGDTRMELSTPLFDEIRIRVKDDQVFTIRVKRQTKNSPYIQNATLNGKPHLQCHIDYYDIIKGGELELTLSDTPNTEWGKQETSQPNREPAYFCKPQKRNNHTSTKRK